MIILKIDIVRIAKRDVIKNTFVRQQKKEIVLKMNEENIPLDTISKVTDLTIEEIQNILNN